MERRHRHSRKSSGVRAVIYFILLGVGLMVAIGWMFWYWNQNDFVPDARPGNPVESKPHGP
jgi:hypothetical protein